LPIELRWVFGGAGTFLLTIRHDLAYAGEVKTARRVVWLIFLIVFVSAWLRAENDSDPLSLLRPAFGKIDQAKGAHTRFTFLDLHHNMNFNEVLANRANEILGGKRGGYAPVHPNDHVNMAQSTNDVIPTAIRLGCLMELGGLEEVFSDLAKAFEKKGKEFDDVLKSGRTHLQDAMPIRLGQELDAYAGSLRRGLKRVIEAADYLRDLGIGGSAVGTGVNVERDYPKLMVKHLSKATKLKLREGADRIQLMQSMGDVAGFSAQLKVLALDLSKIASDLRLLASGPRTGLDEIRLPAVQPGSSIMPGKVNPSIPEMVNQVCFQVFGNDACVSVAAEHGQLELNVMMPVIAWNALHASTILANAMDTLDVLCVEGIQADEARCRALLDRSTAMATALSPYIGYAKTAEVAKESVKTGKPIRELVLERGLIDAKQLDRILSVESMTQPGVPGKEKAK